MSDRASSPNLIESGLNGLKSLIGGGRDNYPLISGTNGKHQLHVVNLFPPPQFKVISSVRAVSARCVLQRSNLNMLISRRRRRRSGRDK